MPTLFISYRREDASGHAGRLHDRLAARFRGARVFMDVDAVPAGTDFVGVISQAVTSSDVVIAVIGPRWATDTGGTLARLHDPSDFVRLEIELALQRDIPIIPTLVGGAAMPRPDVLPPSLQPLAQRQAVVVDDRHFHAGCDRLAAAITDLRRRKPPQSDAKIEETQGRALIMPLAIFHGVAAWPALLAAEATGSVFLAVMTWLSGPVLGELSRRWSLWPGIALGFLFPYLPFIIPAIAIRLGVFEGERYTDMPLWYRALLAALTTSTAAWTLAARRRQPPTAARPALPMAAIVPLTLGIAIALRLFLG